MRREAELGHFQIQLGTPGLNTDSTAGLSEQVRNLGHFLSTLDGTRRLPSPAVRPGSLWEL